MTDIAAAIGRVSTPTLTTRLLMDHRLRNTCVRSVAPVNPMFCCFAGPAYTLRYLPLREDHFERQLLSHPESLMTQMIETAPPGSVLVLDANQRRDVGMLGGNIVTRLKARGIAGVVTDGGMRDLAEIGEIGLPLFSAGAAAPASFSQLMLVDAQQPVSCGGVAVFPGDYVVADGDGVVIVPAELAADVAKSGREQDSLEAYVQRRLAGGERLPGLYPPSEKVQQEFADWKARGEPEDVP